MNMVSDYVSTWLIIFVSPNKAQRYDFDVFEFYGGGLKLSLQEAEKGHGRLNYDF